MVNLSYEKRFLGLISLISIAGIFNLRDVSMLATYGLKSIVLYIIAAFTFLIPVGMSCTILAKQFPTNGGMYIWVSKAIGEKWGAITIWLEYIINLAWVPLVISFVISTGLSMFFPNGIFNAYYFLGIALTILWVITAYNFFGLVTSRMTLAILCILGNVFPSVVLVILFFLEPKSWAFLKIENTFQASQVFQINSYIFFLGAVLGLAGIEAAGFFSQETEIFKKVYPKAIVITIIFVLITSILNTLAVACVIPYEKISIISSISETFSLYFQLIHKPFLAFFLVIMIILGNLAAMNVWFIGPARGLAIFLETKKTIPKIFKLSQKKEVPIGLLLLQSLLCSIIMLGITIFSTISSFYWVVTAIASQFVLLMYLLLLISALKIILRSNKKGLSVIICIGIVISLICYSLSFISPSQLSFNGVKYAVLLLLGQGIIFIFIYFAIKIK